MIRIFALTILITIALTARSQHMLESAAVWWTNFLPVVAYSHLWRGYRIPRLEAMIGFAVFVYICFHAFYFWFSESTLADGVEFWPASAISFIMITLFTHNEIKRNV